ncbi:MAG: hypothetical protein KC609_18780, partial [Myxococcales bacterium]|nr:hypothetical protein [Myxococcales bacterium]
ALPIELRQQILGHERFAHVKERKKLLFHTGSALRCQGQFPTKNGGICRRSTVSSAHDEHSNAEPQG